MNDPLQNYSFKTEDFFPFKLFYQITDARVEQAEAIMEHAKNRLRRKKLTKDGKLIILATDHPGRRVTAMREDPIGMGDRHQYLGRVLRVITDEQFDGVMCTPDMMEEIFIVDYLYKQKTDTSFLDDKVLVGCMNRGGHAGSQFEMEDGYTSYSASKLKQMNMDGGKLMYRLDPADHGSLITIRETADAINELSRLNLYSFLEPVTVEGKDKKYSFKSDIETLVRDAGAAAALGETSLYTWLKLSYNENFERVARATTLPILLLGGAAKDSPYETIVNFEKAMKAAPNVRGAMVGRNVTFVKDEDPRVVASEIAKIVHENYSSEQAIETCDKKRDAGMDLFSKLNW